MLFKKVTMKIGVDGMHCGGCANRVRNALLQIKGIKEATVSLENKLATIQAKQLIDENIIKEAIENLGFTVTSIS